MYRPVRQIQEDSVQSKESTDEGPQCGPVALGSNALQDLSGE
jgi:hypothetical protein